MKDNKEHNWPEDKWGIPDHRTRDKYGYIWKFTKKDASTAASKAKDSSGKGAFFNTPVRDVWRKHSAAIVNRASKSAGKSQVDLNAKESAVANPRGDQIISVERLDRGTLNAIDAVKGYSFPLMKQMQLQDEKTAQDAKTHRDIN